ncbi:unnamed protein product [Spirodela intermedia]|uniref:Uncharacterized protein n=1 Tax=Spirodela intermedia TaxID=51605 RepID=A0A7I8J4M4_SPIIN|nr:unnamed protein product [Spirodela intermedia]CAA6664331.1 unnamed protein product [Spirodela intermedia]
MALEVEGDVFKGPGESTPHGLLEESRAAMEDLATKMLFVKKEGLPKSELRELVTQMSLIFITLRQVNRSILLEEDRVKDETENAKAPVDFTTLQLHNLTYEKNHYLKAIKACKDFRSKHPIIELASEEEFFREAPDDIKGGVLSSDGAQDLMLKRLNYELHQRKELCKLREKLEQRKKGLLEIISNRKKFLSSLPSHLKALKKASLPVQQQFGILHTKKSKQNSAAELLPPPLYIVYSQLLSQKEAFGESIELEILGSIKEAQTFAQQQASKDTGTTARIEASKLDDDVPDDEDEGQRRRKRPKKPVVKDSVDNSGIYQSHPLNIVLHVFDDESSGTKPLKLLSLRFEFLVKLSVVCVGIEGPDQGPENILCNLFPDDIGIELPHQTAKVYAGDSILFDKRNLRPYKWLSPLLEVTKGGSAPSGLALYRHQNRVQTFLQRIRSRKKAQMALEKQLESLARLKWPPLSCGDAVPWALHSPACTLEQWSLIRSAADAASPPQTADSSELASEGRSIREEVESAREDGELPSVMQLSEDLKLSSLKASVELKEHSRSLALMSKSSTLRYDDGVDLMVDSESETEQQAPLVLDPEENSRVPWEEYAAREFLMVLCRVAGGEKTKLEAKRGVPSEAASFQTEHGVDSSSADERSSAEWFNELRAMEAEVNLHILNMVPWEWDEEILSHQVRCLVMLFDLQIERRQTTTPLTQRSMSIIDIGLCKPVTGSMLARSSRGRDRRKMLSWKSMECAAPGYPY